MTNKKYFAIQSSIEAPLHKTDKALAALAGADFLLKCMRIFDRPLQNANKYLIVKYLLQKATVPCKYKQKQLNKQKTIQ